MIVKGEAASMLIKLRLATTWPYRYHFAQAVHTYTVRKIFKL